MALGYYWEVDHSRDQTTRQVPYYPYIHRPTTTANAVNDFSELLLPYLRWIVSWIKLSKRWRVRFAI